MWNDYFAVTCSTTLVEGYKGGLSVADDDGDWPAHIASYLGRLDIVEYLLEQYPAAVDHYAYWNIAVSRNVEVTQFVCRKYPNSVQIPLEHEDEEYLYT